MKYEIQEKHIQTMFAGHEAILKSHGLSLQLIFELYDLMRSPIQEQVPIAGNTEEPPKGPA